MCAILLWSGMTDRFLKLNIEKDTEHEGDWLAAKYPNAFILLYFIARRARRTSGSLDGIPVGAAHIGDWKKIGLSRQNYRTALKILVVNNFVEILETNRTRKKSTNGSTTEGTLVKLLDTRIWDINSELTNHRYNHCPTTAQPLPNHEQERIRKKKNVKKETTPTPSLPVPSKIKFREFVELTQSEFDSLLAKNGEEFLNLMLDVLDAYKGSSGKKYDSDFHTMKQGGWVVNRVKEDLQKQKLAHEKNIRPSQGVKPQGSIQPSDTKFQPGRVLRGSNDERSIPSGVVNE